MFINRKEELKALAEWEKRGRVALITGRRRVGKSRLILEFLKNKKAIYLLSADKGAAYNLEKFSCEISQLTGVPGLRFKDFEEMFRGLEKADISMIALDEFGYLIKAGALGEFQRVIDNILKTKKLILSGSSASLIETRLRGYKSPLYGRVELNKTIYPLKFASLFEWFKGLSMEDAVKLYAVTNGIPKYLEFFEGKNISKEIKEKLFNPDIMLFSDARFILEEELSEPARYFFILESIAMGKNRLSEISAYTKIGANQLPYYLNTLRKIRFVVHEKPLLEKKKGSYKIADYYTCFWFKFISPFFEEIETGIRDNAMSNFDRDFNTFLGYVFEELCMKFSIDARYFNFTRIGRWWHKDREIDFIALNEEAKEALFAECKWQERVNAEAVVKRLAETAGYFKGRYERRAYAVFAKSFDKRIAEFDKSKVLCFDLDDMAKKWK